MLFRFSDLLLLLTYTHLLTAVTSSYPSAHCSNVILPNPRTLDEYTPHHYEILHDVQKNSPGQCTKLEYSLEQFYCKFTDKFTIVRLVKFRHFNDSDFKHISRM